MVTRKEEQLAIRRDSLSASADFTVEVFGETSQPQDPFAKRIETSLALRPEQLDEFALVLTRARLPSTSSFFVDENLYLRSSSRIVERRDEVSG